MMIAPVDQRDFDVGSLEPPRRRNTGKTSADDQDAFFAKDRSWYRRRFLRERFGQNCCHGNSGDLKATQSLVWI
jgi:hypothetical protein